MKVPSIEEANRLIEEAVVLNPGPWIDHNKTAGMCARLIAEKYQGMDADIAYVMGLLHDIGRREGIMDKTIVQVKKLSLLKHLSIRQNMMIMIG